MLLKFIIKLHKRKYFLQINFYKHHLNKNLNFKLLNYPSQNNKND
jgi:hypothetical protein